MTINRDYSSRPTTSARIGMLLMCVSSWKCLIFSSKEPHRVAIMVRVREGRVHSFTMHCFYLEWELSSE